MLPMFGSVLCLCGALQLRMFDYAPDGGMSKRDAQGGLDGGLCAVLKSGAKTHHLWPRIP